MSVLEKIKIKEFEKHSQEKEDLKTIPLKGKVTVKYKTESGETRLFRGVVIAKNNSGVHSTISVCKQSAYEKKRLTFKFVYYSPSLISVTLDRRPNKASKRAKLYYLQEKSFI